MARKFHRLLRLQPRHQRPQGAAGTSASACTGPDSAVDARAPTEEEVFFAKVTDQLNAEKPMGDAFFDYDKAEIRPESRAALQKNADFMKKWASVVVSVEGHATCGSSNTTSLPAAPQAPVP